MSLKLLSFHLLIRDFLVNLFAGLIGAGIIILLSGKPWIGIVLFILFIAGSSIYLLFKKYERMIKFLRAGAYRYYFSFPVEENLEVWKEVKRDCEKRKPDK